MIQTARGVLAAIAWGCAALVCAQDFPVGASMPSADELQQHVAGRVFDVKLADGTDWRLQYTGNGYFYVDTSKGFKGTGTWRVEEGRLCGHLRGRDPSCNEVRLHDGVLHMRRDSGEMIRFVPR